jgi:hypothetical protein
MARLVRALLLAAIATALVGVHVLLVRPWLARWGATDDEVARPLPGDELWPSPSKVETRAVSIEAPPPEVWPWIRQLGQDRGGFYSYTWLENLAGAHMRNADVLLPGVGERVPGEKLWLARPDVLDGMGYVEVAANEPGRALVLVGHSGTDPTPSGTWAFVVEPRGNGSRLLARGRAGREGVRGSAAATLFDHVVYQPMHFVMERRMLLGVRERAEGRIPGAWRDGVEIAIWLVALGAALLAASVAIVRRFAGRAFALFAASGAALLVLPLLRPPLAVSATVAIVLAAGVPWSLLAPRWASLR